MEDAAGTVTDYRHDPVGNLVETIVDAAVGGKRSRTTYEYDIRGHKVRQVDPDMGIWTYRYNGFGRLITQTDPDNA